MSTGETRDWPFATEEEQHDVTSACVDGLPAWSLSAALRCSYLSALKPSKTLQRHTSFYGKKLKLKRHTVTDKPRVLVVAARTVVTTSEKFQLRKELLRLQEAPRDGGWFGELCTVILFPLMQRMWIPMETPTA